MKLGYFFVGALSLASVFGIPFNVGQSFEYSKFFLISVILTLGSLFYFIAKKNLFLPLKKRECLALALLFLSLILSSLQQPYGERLFGLTLLLMWTLCVLLLGVLVVGSGASEFFKRFLKLELPIMFFVFLILLYNEIFVQSWIRPFFGNSNIAACFVGAALLRVPYLFNEQLKRWRVVSFATFCIGIVLIFFLNSRASIVALILSAAIYHFEWWANKRSRATILSVVVLSVLGAFFYFSKGLLSMKYRFSYWENTLCMIKDNPLGVGLGAFPYRIEKYFQICNPLSEINEMQVLANPHNMFLEIISEIGLLGFLSSFFFFASVFFSLGIKDLKLKKTIRALILFFIAIGFFEFPHESASSYFLLALVSGVCVFSREKEYFNLKIRRTPVFLLSLVVCFFFGIKFYLSNILTAYTRSQDVELLEMARRDTENLSAAYWSVLGHLKSNDFDLAELELSKVRNRFGDYSLVHKLEWEVASRKKDIKRACLSADRYENIFGVNNHLHSYKLIYCEGD